MDKDTLKIIIDTLFDLLEERVKNPMLKFAIKLLRELITAALLGVLLKRLKDKGAVALLFALGLYPSIACAGDADARAALALARARLSQSSVVAPATAPTPPTPIVQVREQWLEDDRWPGWLCRYVDGQCQGAYHAASGVWQPYSHASGWGVPVVATTRSRWSPAGAVNCGPRG